ncbi:MAG: hypothetical protein R2715_07725 [Ilumatobacteraceae bacterium]
MTDATTTDAEAGAGAGAESNRPTTSAAVEIRAMEPADWPDVAAIYEAGIATRNATFETAAPRWDAWDADT